MYTDRKNRQKFKFQWIFVGVEVIYNWIVNYVWLPLLPINNYSLKLQFWSIFSGSVEESYHAAEVEPLYGTVLIVTANHLPVGHLAQGTHNSWQDTVGTQN